MKRSLPARLARWVLTAILGAALASIVVVGSLRWLPVPVTAFMMQERIAAQGAAPPLEQHHDWVPWPAISKNAALAVIAAEDQKFFGHAGFDFEAIERALGEAQRGRRLRGASTISQQVAKNLFLWGGQSWLRKGLEAWFTVWIECLWPKQRILEVYLNSAQFGRGTWGIEAASRRFFGKGAAHLTRAEAALLAAVLPNPDDYRAADPGPYVRRRQAWILGQMDGLAAAGLLKELN